MTKCPKCGSENMKHPQYSKAIISGQLFENLRYECYCGYTLDTEPLDAQKRHTPQRSPE
jgi:hypothetical protein